jgi:PAS domain S-box-containing protein
MNGETNGYDARTGDGLEQLVTEDMLNALQVVVADKAELYRIADENLNRLTVIYELTKAILSMSDLDELLRKITEEVAKLFNASGSMVRLLEDEKLKIKASFGIPEGIIDALTVGLGQGIAGTAAMDGKTILVKIGDDFGKIAPVINLQTAINIPLKLEDQVIGTFGIFDKRAADGTVISFTEDDVQILDGFASIAAIVIEKFRMYDNAVRQEREAIKIKEEVEELKDYLQGLIENSPDAIVTYDLNGVVRSWNMGAEKMYGFSRGEVTGGHLPFVPEFLVEIENDYRNRVKRGDTLKNIETIRRTKDGKLIDVNLTLSPIKDANGNIIAISGIARDITEKKRVEKDLIRRNSEMQRLLFISSTMRGELELDRLLRMVLTAVTMGDGLGFNRAMLFLVDEEKQVISGAMGVGPGSDEEAWAIWSKISIEQKSIHTIMDEIRTGPLVKDSFMDRLCCGVEIPLDDVTVLTRAVKERRAFNVVDIHTEEFSDTILIQQLGTTAYAVVPIVSKDRAIGALWVDNIFSRRPIMDHDMEVLQGFTDQMAAAVENAGLFARVTRAEQELENIFESITDLLYVVSADYTILRANRAVVRMLNKPVEEIVGKKSFEVFKDVDANWHSCTIPPGEATKNAFIQELDDPRSGGAHLVSCSPILDNDGELVGTVHLVRDITEIKKLRERVVFTERMAALGEMAAKVAHEIRNPLLSIGGFARRMEKKVEPGMKEYARIIVDEVGRLEGILNDALSFVKSAPMQKRATDLRDIADNVLSLLEPAAFDRGNLLRREIGEPVTVMVDYDRIKEAILNIVTNANQSTENGTIIISAYKKTDAAGRRVAVVEIEDDGCGIGDEDLNRIFDPFFTTRSTGTGLGLSITKRIIEEHGGWLEVESSVGKGTKFSVYFPVEE